jgi:diguanylate cyclase (GGDEF)-like protein
MLLTAAQGLFFIKSTQLLSSEPPSGRASVMTDPLSGLKSRAALDEYCHTDRDCGSVLSTGAVLLSISSLRQVNTEYGRASGDEMICEIGRILTAACTEKSTAYRNGGNEFIILSEDYTQDTGDRILGDILSGILNYNSLHTDRKIRISYIMTDNHLMNRPDISGFLSETYDAYDTLKTDFNG